MWRASLSFTSNSMNECSKLRVCFSSPFPSSSSCKQPIAMLFCPPRIRWPVHCQGIRQVRRFISNPPGSPTSEHSCAQHGGRTASYTGRAVCFERIKLRYAAHTMTCTLPSVWRQWPAGVSLFYIICTHTCNQLVLRGSCAGACGMDPSRSPSCHRSHHQHLCRQLPWNRSGESMGPAVTARSSTAVSRKPGAMERAIRQPITRKPLCQQWATEPGWPSGWDEAPSVEAPPPLLCPPSVHG